MPFLKIVISGIIIWIASELGKKSGKIGGLVLSLPLTTIITLVWIWIETNDPVKIASVSKETLIFVIPSFVFFIALPLLLGKGFHFYVSFSISIALTLFAYLGFFKLRGEM